MLYSFFWVIPRLLNFMCRRFGTICSIFIVRVASVFYVLMFRSIVCSIFIVGVHTTYEDGTERSETSEQNSDAGDSSKRKSTTRTMLSMCKPRKHMRSAVSLVGHLMSCVYAYMTPCHFSRHLMSCVCTYDTMSFFM